MSKHPKSDTLDTTTKELSETTEITHTKDEAVHTKVVSAPNKRQMLKYRSFWIIIFIVSSLSLVFYYSKSRENPLKNEKFPGEKQWKAYPHCEHNDTNIHENPDIYCTRYMVDYTWVNMEILSISPILIVYRKFYAKWDVDLFISLINEKQLIRPGVLEKGGVAQSVGRQANGTWFAHRENKVVEKFFNQAQRFIPNANFSAAEMWHVISYLPGGHYAPHCDAEKGNPPSKTMERLGNRVLSFFVMLKPATRGGGTVFPKLNVTIKAEPGDAMLWTNLHVNGKIDKETLHGGCPVYEGNKLAATLWVRRIGNEIRVKAKDASGFDINRFVRPREFYVPGNG